MRLTERFGRVLAALGVISALIVTAATAAGPVAPHGYPRLAYYGSIRGNGFPFYNFPIDTNLDTAILDKVARFEEIILDVNPIYPYRPDVLSALRARNPDAKMLAYVVGHHMWDPNDFDSLNHYPTRYRRILDHNNGWLYNQRNNKYYAGNVNLAKRDPNGRLVIADSLALLWKDVAIDSGIWDGLFFDILCDDMYWSEVHGESINLAEAGYTNRTDFNNSWHAATDTIAALMRNWGGPDYILVGNCALGTKYSTFNGWMREGFPFETGGTWYTNMFWRPGGYMTDEANFLEPRHNYIFTFNIGTDWTSPLNQRLARWGLGSATLGDGFGVFGGQDRDAYHSDWWNWWFDEYGVDLQTGMTTTAREGIGWLGQPLSDMYQVVWVKPEVPDGIVNWDFETSVTQNWSFGGMIPASIARDTTTAGHGRSSSRITVPTANPVEWKVNYSTPIAMSLDPNTLYSVSFWAKASPPREIPVVIGTPGQGPWDTRLVWVDEVWRSYQVPFNTMSHSGNTNLQFYLAKTAGATWFDNVHLQQGESTVYRRDFQNGTVLVNPSETSDATVTLERPYRRILGATDPIVNDGSVSAVQYLPIASALFLLGDDITPPAQVTDLRQVSIRP
ncbi:MAG: carbohydrate binding domain-containing protein [Candidatus Eisenbacteria bacterium]|nr:carbohydrate binding domain-containing protein [Candidatus Eisenbacteria bacterium]